MSEKENPIFEDYKRAFEKRDWPEMSGILAGLLSAIVTLKNLPHEEFSVQTAKKILAFRRKQSELSTYRQHK